jgi:thymidylate synthase (FAD)
MKTELLSSWGDDLTVVNNARVSFSKQSEWEVDSFAIDDHVSQFQYRLSTVDRNLIGFLARGCSWNDWDKIEEDIFRVCETWITDGVDETPDALLDVLKHVKNMPTHWAPFANGVGMRFRIKSPFPIMRQVFKHKVGSVESEVSRRYVTEAPEFFYPDWRYAADNVKQGSAGPLSEFDRNDANMIYETSTAMALQSYNDLLEIGVCPEQARFVLPQGTYTEAIVSNSLYGWANFYNQRAGHSHAQKEIADIAEAVSVEAQRLFPVSWAALTQ